MSHVKEHLLLGGHDFRDRRLYDGRPSRKRGARLGITCYNCGTYTTHADRDLMIMQHVSTDRLRQCPAFHADLFGGNFARRQKSIRNKWSKPDGD